jgi:hypothetical protein
VWHEVFGDFDLISQNFFRFVGVLLAAAVAAYLDFLWQHGKRSIGIGLSEQNVMLIADVSLVVEAMIFADNTQK